MTPNPESPVPTPPEQGATSPPAPAPRPPRRRFGGAFLIVLLLILLIAGGVGAYAYFGIYKSVSPVTFHRGLVGVLNPDKLDDQFTDKDGDLIADPPTNKKKLLNPDTLLFSTLDTDHEKAQKKWKEFIAHLAKVTRKKVELIEPLGGGLGLVKEMKEGKVHIAMLSTGTVPLAVNSAGFVPCVVPANDKGKFEYQMEILVPADSPIKGLKDLKGRTLTLASMSSLSSFKAPLMVLYEEAGLLPGRDYEISISTGQFASIVGVAKRKDGSKKKDPPTTFEAVAIANDLVPQAVADEELDKSSFRSIYKSKSYPPFCIGYMHNLDPALAKQIKDALASFKFEGTALGKALKGSNQTQFVPIKYKQDWESVRAVERALKKLVDDN